MYPHFPEKTKGQKIVGIDFNPANDQTVHEIKQRCAELIDFISQSMESRAMHDELTDLQKELYQQAIMRTLDAQMWLVKAHTFRTV